MMLRLTLSMLALAGAALACGERASPRTPPASDLTLPPIGAAPAVVAAAAPPQEDLVLAQVEDDEGRVSCEVQERSSRAVRAHVSVDGCGAGPAPRCVELAMDGRLALIDNRGLCAKVVATGKTMPCGAGAFAPSLSSCVRLDASPFTYGATTEGDLPLDLELCRPTPEDAPQDCRVLATVPRGRNRVDMRPDAREVPRTWDAAYCSDTLVAVVANGEVSMFDVRSGKRVARAASADATRVRCEGKVATALAGPRVTSRVTAP